MTRNQALAQPSRAVRDARELLGVERLALAIHDASFPGDAADDIGRGALASAGAIGVVAFAAETGFDALQLGPQGLTDEDDPSPYLGALFSRNPLSISLARLADADEEWGELLPASRLAALVASRPPGAERRVPYLSVFRAQRAALGAAFEGFEKRRAAGDSRALRLAERIERFAVEAAWWLESDACYETLRSEYRGRDWPHWEGARAELDRGLGDSSRRDAACEARRAELARRYEPALRFYRFVQFLAHDEHQRLRRQSGELGLELIGDLQVGISPRDTWRLPGLFLRDYRLGAPPSRTNPEGQPWDYPVLDPDAYHSRAQDGDGPALRFVTARMQKIFAEFDAVRRRAGAALQCARLPALSFERWPWPSAGRPR